MKIASSNVSSSSAAPSGAGLEGMRGLLQRYTQSFAFRQFFSNFIAINQRASISSVTFLPVSVEPSVAVLGAAFAYHAARIFGERILITQIGPPPAEDYELTAAALGKHASLRGSEAGEVDIMLFSGFPNRGQITGSELNTFLKDIKTGYNLQVHMLSPNGVDPSWYPAVGGPGNAAFLVSTPDQVRNGQTAKQVRRLTSLHIALAGCVIMHHSREYM